MTSLKNENVPDGSTRPIKSWRDVLGFPETIYVVMKSVGEYSDRDVESVIAFYEEAAAQDYVEGIEEELKRFLSIRISTQKHTDLDWENKSPEQRQSELLNKNLELLGDNYPYIKMSSDVYSERPIGKEHYSYYSYLISHPVNWYEGGWCNYPCFHIETVKILSCKVGT